MLLLQAAQQSSLCTAALGTACEQVQPETILQIPTVTLLTCCLLLLLLLLQIWAHNMYD
jgi:hypothetical protein